MPINWIICILLIEVSATLFLVLCSFAVIVLLIHCYCALRKMLFFAAQEIVDALNSNKSVSILEFKGNTLGVNAAKAIGTALEQHPNIKVR